MRVREILIFVFMLLVSSSLFSQGRQYDPEAMAKRTTEAMKERLKLDDKQLVKVEEINLASAKKRSEIFASTEGDRTVAREKMVVVNEETDKKLKEVLKDDQWKEYLVMKEEQRQARQNRGN